MNEFMLKAVFHFQARSSTYIFSDSPFTKVQKLSAGLRRSTWKHMKRCDDMLVIALMTSGRAVSVPTPYITYSLI